jgi:hypothetical protein
MTARFGEHVPDRGAAQAVGAEEAFQVVQPQHASGVLAGRLHRGGERLLAGGLDQLVVRTPGTSGFVGRAALARRRLADNQYEPAPAEHLAQP